jgi:hypothetical protein
MAYLISTGIHYHWIRKITASTHGNGALKLTLHGDSDASDCQFNEAEITVFTEDVAMVERLIEAINAVKPTPALPSYEEALKDADKARILFDASKGGNVKDITEDHRFALADVFQREDA